MTVAAAAAAETRTTTSMTTAASAATAATLAFAGATATAPAPPAAAAATVLTTIRPRAKSFSKRATEKAARYDNNIIITNHIIIIISRNALPCASNSRAPHPSC